MSVREYLKLARSFNAVLTGVSPVMGAIAMKQFDILILFLLFIIGFFGHTFGFVFNDIMDYKIDKKEKALSDRPLLSGTISMRNAWLFAIASMAICFIIALFIAYRTNNYYPILILGLAAFFTTVYDISGKRILGTDVLLSIGVFFFVLYGATTVVNNIYDITLLAWIVCALGLIQVQFMATICGAMKDIANDFKLGLKTIPIRMGGRITDGKLILPKSYKALAYFIQIANIVFVLLPYFIIWGIDNLTVFQYIQIIAIFLIGAIMFFLSYKLLFMERFDRKKARMLIGTHYMTNFMIVPIMLMSLNPWAGILLFFPFLGFILSNIILHGSLLVPKTM